MIKAVHITANIFSCHSLFFLMWWKKKQFNLQHFMTKSDLPFWCLLLSGSVGSVGVGGCCCFGLVFFLPSRNFCWDLTGCVSLLAFPALHVGCVSLCCFLTLHPISLSDPDDGRTRRAKFMPLWWRHSEMEITFEINTDLRFFHSKTFFFVLAG